MLDLELVAFCLRPREYDFSQRTNAFGVPPLQPVVAQDVLTVIRLPT